jgi:hypothetical protein
MIARRGGQQNQVLFTIYRWLLPEGHRDVRPGIG